jgi:hypothetical protein
LSFLSLQLEAYRTFSPLVDGPDESFTFTFDPDRFFAVFVTNSRDEAFSSYFLYKGLPFSSLIWALSTTFSLSYPFLISRVSVPTWIEIKTVTYSFWFNRKIWITVVRLCIP